MEEMKNNTDNYLNPHVLISYANGKFGKGFYHSSAENDPKNKPWTFEVSSTFYRLTK
jgi:hypothetical protein